MKLRTDVKSGKRFLQLNLTLFRDIGNLHDACLFVNLSESRLNYSKKSEMTNISNFLPLQTSKLTCQFSDAIKLKGCATPTRSALSIGLDEVTIGDGMSEVSSVGDLGVEDLHLVSDSNHHDDEDSMSICSSASDTTLFAPDNVGFLHECLRCIVSDYLGQEIPENYKLCEPICGSYIQLLFLFHQ